MQILSWLLCIVGIGFGVAGFMGHDAAWAAAAICFFAATANAMSKKSREK